MAACPDLSFIKVEDYSDNIIEALRPHPANLPSPATLEALQNISLNTIPLLGLSHPNLDPTLSSIHDPWQLCSPSPSLLMQELLADSTPISLEGNPDFGPIERPGPKCPPTPVPCPVQSDDEPPEWDIDIPGAFTGPKCRHDSYFPPTPPRSPIDDGEEWTELSSGKITISTLENEAKGLLDGNGPSNNPQGHGCAASREELGQALRSLRNRRPREWSERIPEVLARGKLENLLNIMGLADREGIEW